MIRILLLAGILLIFNGCEFESSEIHFVDIEEPSGEIPVAELSFRDSVVILHEPTSLSYDVKFSIQNVFLVEFYLNQQLYSYDQDASGNVLLDPGPGIHDFEMIIYTSTESGSIAEKVGVEAFVYSQSWTVIMEDIQNRHLSIDAVEIGDQGVVIEWEWSRGFDFKAYEIIKINSTGEEQCLGYYEDRYINSCQDPYFVGGTADYNLRLHTHHFQPVDGIKRTLSLPRYRFTILLTDSVNMQFRWSACMVEGNYDSYELLSDNDNLLYRSTEIQDTAVILPIDTKKEQHFKLLYNSKIPDTLCGAFCIERTFISGTNPLPDFEIITQSFYPPYMVHSPSFTYNPQNGQLVSQDFHDHRGVFAVTSQNRYLLAGNSIYEGGEYWKFQRTLKNIPEDIFNRSNPHVSLSANPNRTYFESDNHAYMFNLDSDAIIETFGENSLRRGILSPGGDHVLSPGYWDNTLKIFSTSRLSGSYLLYEKYHIYPCNGNPVYVSEECFLVVSGSELIRYNSREYELEMTVSTPAEKMLCYDPISKTVLASSSGYLYVYDPTDLSIVHDQPIENHFSLRYGHVAYMNKKVFLRGNTTGQAIMLSLSF